MQLKDKVAIVTGAAQGIGAAVAQAFAREGARVGVVDIAPDRAEAVAAALRKSGAEAIGIGCNVARRDDVDAMVAAMDARFGRVDVLVNNAGIIRPAMLHKMTAAQWDEVLAVHLTGSFNCLQAVAPGMMERRYGRIVNVTSTAGVLGHDRADQLQRRQGGHPRAHDVGGEGAREARHHRQRDRAGRRDADDRDDPHRRALQGQVPRPHPDGPLGGARRDRAGVRVPRLRRRVLRHRTGARGRRRNDDLASVRFEAAARILSRKRAYTRAAPTRFHSSQRQEAVKASPAGSASAGHSTAASSKPQRGEMQPHLAAHRRFRNHLFHVGQRHGRAALLLQMQPVEKRHDLVEHAGDHGEEQARQRQDAEPERRARRGRPVAAAPRTAIQDNGERERATASRRARR